MSVQVHKGRATIQVAGKRFTVRLPDYDSGYLGLQIDGRGYAAWRPTAHK